MPTLKYILVTSEQYDELQKGFDKIISEASKYRFIAPDAIDNIVNMTRFNKELLKKFYEDGKKKINEHYDEVIKQTDKKPEKDRDALIPENMVKQFQSAIEDNLKAIKNISPSLAEVLQNTLDFISSVSKKVLLITTSVVQYITETAKNVADVANITLKLFPFILVSAVVVGGVVIYNISKRRY